MKKIQVQDLWFPDMDNHFEKYLNKGKYQFQIYNLVLQETTSRRVALDIGAHVGIWSSYMIKDFSAIIAFEPMPELKECYIKNIPTATLHEVVLGPKLPLNVSMSKLSQNTGTSHVINGSSTQTKDLDSFGFTDVDLIKIDVEGFEKYVIEGGEKTITNNRPVIVVEQKGHELNYNLERFSAIHILQNYGMIVKFKIGGDFIMIWPQGL